MRDELWAAFDVADADPSVEIDLCGAGASFCSGGDLDEFGTLPDPATGHLVRLSRSLGARLSQLAGRTTVQLHGPCVGSGIELAAFGGRIVATPDTVVSLPEVSFGLIPGAGGTASLPPRIGRHRTAWLALSGSTIGARTGLEWGLIDTLVE